MNGDFLAALEDIEREKGISKKILFEAIELALVSAYRRNFNAGVNDVRVCIEQATGKVKLFSLLKVVQEVTSKQEEIFIEEAYKHDKDCELGDIIEIEITPRDFGRIAAQTAKQVVIQRIREAERELVYEDYIDREEDIITGTVQHFDKNNTIVDLGKTEAILPPTEQIPGETFRQRDRIKTFITEVRKTTKGTQVFVSRTHPGFLKRLFELEVPEIFEGTVEIKAVAREAGNRSKIAVSSSNKNVDPIGACVGAKGVRVQAVRSELKGERIDIIKWSEDPEEFIANALSPSKVISVNADEKLKMAKVVVPDYQLSLAIGKEGQNARLAAKLTFYKIDIVSESQLKA